MAHLLGGETLHLAYPTKVVFDSVTVGVNDGDRIGIVGRNGDGKSSLLGLLTGRITPDSGRVTCRSGLRVTALEQADTLDGSATVAQTLVGDRPEHEWAGEARVRDVVAGRLAPARSGTRTSRASVRRSARQAASLSPAVKCGGNATRRTAPVSETLHATIRTGDMRLRHHAVRS